MPLIGLASQYRWNASKRMPARFWGVLDTYLRAIAASGGVPVVLPPQDPDRLERALKRLDAVVLTGGGDLDPALFGEEPVPELGEVSPERDQSELFLARHAAATGLPLLGVCRGMQVAAVALGGRLHQDLARAGYREIEHYQDSGPPALAHSVRLTGNGLLKELFGERFRVNSYHHQAVRDPGPLAPLAEAPDGVLEAAHLPDHPFYLTVQWHPEMLPEHWGLFAALVEAASRRSRA